MNHDEEFDGFITPSGELVSIKDVDGMLSFFSKRTENRDEIVKSLWALAGECAEAGYFNAACGYYEKILLLVDRTDEKAEVLLAMERMLERSGRNRAFAGH